MAKNTGTRIRTWMVDVIMPPTMGAAIGFMTSEPMPVSRKIGTRLASTTATVMELITAEVLRLSWVINLTFLCPVYIRAGN